METPRSAWNREPRAVKRLSRERIVNTALEILATEGMEAVNMRRVAQALETGAASLYAHVSNKTELSELMLDRVLEMAPVPDPDPKRWTEQISEVLRNQVRVMTAYPGIARVRCQTITPVGPNDLLQTERMIAILRAGGLSVRQAAQATDMLCLYTRAFAYAMSMWTFGTIDRDDHVPSQREQQIREYMNAFPGEFPNMLQTSELFSAETAPERFDLAVEMFVAGLTYLAARNADRPANNCPTQTRR
ncbi:TetR/AcrR family transcriptional regulator [Streptomyces gibsoniae]|uniref:TetR/AcrR family transcriptional regulator n=1 Tax=Streptomyces gibsoniae TaxID=3075529 RepID=A0ABU2TY07_9ACTN|nr:TetR/AcrR family transcriptional regulator [Streptomyces sp. DSM 41699]MDT0465702.1 TetR/AcrR family transcriptional regulator [Streptomyces sp. DSM 41699]